MKKLEPDTDYSIDPTEPITITLPDPPDPSDVITIHSLPTVPAPGAGDILVYHSDGAQWKAINTDDLDKKELLWAVFEIEGERRHEREKE